MPELNSIIKSYLAFTSSFDIDRSQIEYPELLPVCKEFGVTYDEIIAHMDEK